MHQKRSAIQYCLTIYSYTNCNISTKMGVNVSWSVNIIARHFKTFADCNLNFIMVTRSVYYMDLIRTKREGGLWNWSVAQQPHLTMVFGNILFPIIIFLLTLSITFALPSQHSLCYLTSGLLPYLVVTNFSIFRLWIILCWKLLYFVFCLSKATFLVSATVG